MLCIVVALALVGMTLYRVSLTTPLLSAVTQEDVEAVSRLLRHGAFPNAVDQNGNTALYLALAEPGGGSADKSPDSPERRERIADLLLEAGADPNRPNPTPPIVLAIQHGHPDLVKKLLAHGVKPNALYSNIPLLMLAVRWDREGKPLMTQALLTAGADAHVRCPFVGTTSGDPENPSIYCEELPLITAIRFNNGRTDDSAMIETLLSHGVNIDVRDHTGQTALAVAAASGRLNDVRVLMAHGADPSLTDRQGRTPLQASEAACADFAMRQERDRVLRLFSGETSGGESDDVYAADVTRYKAVESLLSGNKSPSTNSP